MPQTLPVLSAWLIALSAAIVFTLGLIHLVFTFHGRRFEPRDPAVYAGMQASPLYITRETTVWRAWVGFNASHSYGVMLFGLVWGWLAWHHPAWLLQSSFLLWLGLALLAAYVQLAWRYWFSIPFRGVSLALLLYAAALALAWS